jgi:DNA (cytosine-5)-methyltransferase 1
MGLEDSRGQLVHEFVRLVREILPVGFVMENVKGMLNWQGGRAIKALEYEFSEPVVHDGKEYHYEVSHDVLNSADYGVPQFRERVFIVGNRIGKKYTFPPPTHGDLSKAELLGSDLLPYATVLDAIGELPEADEPSEVAKRVSKTIKGRIERHGY